ncbi:Zn-dependent exopeptidase M28 [Weissella confusa]|uniref:M28 family metallopeptidase n=1 Tax=Weissella confusa TaxID=1583 RepID=UPI0010814ED1|nr:M28 family peptidase [Weissella confusa]MBJ7636088.1 M28 family peptidase [Weissella confusa]TGE47026.1 Zn-dependent exopeptidase M28 [Weissella confusa]
MRELGYQVEQQQFDAMDWEDHGATLKVDGQEIPVQSADYSNPANVVGDLVIVDTLESLQTANLKGRICVLTGELTAEVLMPKNFTFYNPESHQQIIAALESGEPAAIISVSHSDEPTAVIQDGDFEIPVLGVSQNDGEKLQSGHRAQVVIKTSRSKSTGENVLGYLGEGKKIAIVAHIDTAPKTIGALDNASGVATLLAIAEKLKDYHGKSALEFVIMNGEDNYAMPGEMVVSEKLAAELATYKIVVNLDGIGMRGSKIAYSDYELPDDFKEVSEKTFSQGEEFVTVDPWPMGDHMVYVAMGVPAIALTSADVFAQMDSLHGDADNADVVGVKMCDVVADAVARFIEAID